MIEKDGAYFEVFAVKDGERYNTRIISVEEVSDILFYSLLDGLSKIIGIERINQEDESTDECKS